MQHPTSRSRLAVLVALLVVLATALVPATAASSPIEDFADYQPQTKCSPKAKAGADYLADWLVKRYGGGRGRIGSACSDSVSEHQEGRAVDWRMDATKKKQRKQVQKFLKWAFAADKKDNPAAKARRMGIMYVIWNDKMWASWREFEPKPYLSSSCKNKKKCSKTLRHRDHVHVSLSRKGGFAKTSWYDGKVEKD